MAEIKVTADTRQAERAIDNLKGALNGLASIALGGTIAQQLIQITSEVQEMTNKLTFATGSVTGANKAFQTLSRTAQSTGSNLGGTVDLFTKLAQSATFSGSSTEALATITDNFNKTLQISGASGAGAASALYQFAQAMQKGSLNGDEFRTLMETNGYLMSILEQQTGKTRAELIQMSSQGRLSAEIIGRALTESTKITEDYAKTTRTIPQAFENVQTASAVLIKRLNDATGAGAGFVKILEFLAKNQGVLIGVFTGLTVAIGALLIPLIPAATAMAVLTGGAAVAGAVALGAALGYAADKAGVFEEKAQEANQSQAETNRLAKAGLVINTQKTTQEIEFAKKLTDSINALKAANNELSKEKAIRSLSLEVEKVITAERAKAAAVGASLSPELEKQLRTETFRKLRLEEQLSINKEFLSLSSQINVLSISDVAERQVASQLEAYRLKLSSELYETNKRDLETSIRKNVYGQEQLSLNRDLLNLSSQINVLGIQDVGQRQIISQLESFRLKLSAQTYNNNKDDLEVAIRKSIITQAEVATADSLKKAQQDTNLLLVQDSSQRKYIETIQAAQLKYGSLYTGVLKSQTEELARQLSINERLAQGVAAAGKFDVNILKAQQDAEQAANDAALANKLISQEAYELRNFEIKQKYRDKDFAAREAAAAQEFRNMGYSNSQAEKMAAERNKVEKMTKQEQIKFGLDTYGKMLNDLGTFNKDAFKAAKAYNIAMAIMDTHTMAVAAFKSLAGIPIIGPALGAVAAGAAIASGMARVATIRSQSYSGRALGGPVMGGESYLVGENGPEIFTPNTTGGITRNQDIQGGDNVNINFNINTVDATGFDTLLATRKPMIIQMVRTAMNDKGNRSLV